MNYEIDTTIQTTENHTVVSKVKSSYAIHSGAGGGLLRVHVVGGRVRLGMAHSGAQAGTSGSHSVLLEPSAVAELIAALQAIDAK